MKDDFKDSMGYRNPVVPFFGEDIEENYENDEYVNVLCDLLKVNAPELLSRFRYIVIESAKRSEQSRKELIQMEEDRFKMIGEIHAQEDKLDYELTQLSKEPGESKWQPVLTIVLTVGLSIFMIVGVAKLFNVPAEDIFKPDDINDVLMLAVSIFAAASINIGERQAIESHTKYMFDVERHASMPDTSNPLGDVVEQSRPAVRKWKLNPAFYVAAAILICETAFVSLGFLSTKNPFTAQPMSNVEVVAVIAAAALAGLVNIALAWGNALQKASWERENLQLKKEIVNKHFSSASNFSSKQQLNDLEKRISKKEKEVELTKKLSVEEHVRFSQDLADHIIPKHFGVDTSISTHMYSNGSKRQTQPKASKY